MHAVIAVDFHQNENKDFDENSVRYLILNTIRANKVKFEKEFGQLVICCDAGNVWRRDVFPYYKFRRSENKKESLIDWNTIYKSFNKITEELKEHFSFPVVHVDKCEGDDVIATLCQSFPDEKFLILSGDKDFVQLHTNPNVTQYSPVLKTPVVSDDPVRQLRTLVLKGDIGDGCPSVFSADNYLAIREKGQRSKPISEKMITESLDDLDAFLNKYDVRRNFERNEQLIDLSKIPDECRSNILEEFRIQRSKPKKNVLPYLINHKQRVLSEKVADFAYQERLDA